MNNITGLDKNSFFKDILREFLWRSKKGEGAQDCINYFYNTYKIFLKNELQISTEDAEKIMSLNDILDKLYEIFSDSKTRELIVRSGLEEGELAERLAYRILGAPQNEIDIKKLFDNNLIETVKTSKKKNVHYKPIETETLTYEFTSDDGEAVTIKNIGGLYYKTAFGVEKSLNKYIINRHRENSPEISEEIFSNISIVCMHDPNYRNAILSGLLGEANIARLSSSGYIGTISEQKNSLKIGEEKLKAGIYMHKFSNDYTIEYDAEDVTAVMIYENETKKDIEIRNKEER